MIIGTERLQHNLVFSVSSEDIIGKVEESKLSEYSK